MTARKRVIVYVDDETGKLDLVSSHVPEGAVLEVRRRCREGTRHFIDPVVLEIDRNGTMTVDTRL